jgi:hypothetical protein
MSYFVPLGKQGIKWTKGFYGVELRNVQIVHRRLYIFMSQEIFVDNIESVFEQMCSKSIAEAYAQTSLVIPATLLACLTAH